MVIQEMTTAECLEVLARAQFARLACSRDNQPYIVPTYFAFEDPFLYGFTTPGLKLEWMRSNPQVCVEVDEVSDADHWASVVVLGLYEELNDEDLERRGYGPGRHAARAILPSGARAKMDHAHDLLEKHAQWWEAGCASCVARDPAGAVVPVYYRIRIGRITGRRSSSGALKNLQSAHSGSQRHGWLNRVFHVRTNR